MQLTISSRKVLSAEESSAIEAQVDVALSRLAHHVNEVSVIVRDLNGPKGGVDQFVRLTAHLKGIPAVTVSGCHATLSGAINQSAQRLGQAVTRHIKRFRLRRGRESMAGNGHCKQSPASEP
jgi:putative sigma-54 modulation protein